MSQRILIPYDLKPESEVALDHAVHIANKTRSVICILHVVSSDLDKPAAEIALSRITSELANKCHQMPESIVAVGQLTAQVREIAANIKAALILMPTHGLRGWQKITGSLALLVVSETNTPFIVVQSKPFPAHGYKTIVIPVQFREQLHEAVPTFIQFAKLFDADVHFFTQEHNDIIPVGFHLPAIEEAFVNAGIRLHVAHHSETGSFAKSVVRYSSSVNADLICAMNFSYEHLYSMFPRTEEEDLIYNDANIPVMMYTPHAQEDGGMVIPFIM